MSKAKKVTINEQDDIAEIKIQGKTIVIVRNRAEESFLEIEVLDVEGNQISNQSFNAITLGL